MTWWPIATHSVVHMDMSVLFHMTVAPLMYMMMCLLAEHLAVHGMMQLVIV